MADVASLLAEFQKGIEGKDTGLGATVKFDFEGAGCIFLDGKSNPNTVSDEDIVKLEIPTGAPIHYIFNEDGDVIKKQDLID